MLGILGGGFSGLSLAYLYHGESEILEMNDTIGGHCRSHTKDGFRYDEGGHILFSRNQNLLQKLLDIMGPNISQHYRMNKIWYKKRFVKYPFENGLGDLDKDDIYDCLINYLNNNYPDPTNFREWIYYLFGKGIAEKYLIPYNEKIWKTDLTKMTIDWVGGRIPRPPKEDIVKSALGISTEGYTHQLNFYYPLRGGIQSLPDSLALLIKNKCKITSGFRVRSVRKIRDGWAVSNGYETRHYEKLICTIPVQELLKCMEAVPSEVIDGANRLHYNSSVFVMLGLKDCLAKDITSVYFPDPSLPFHRVGFPHSYDPECVPKNNFIAVAEISCPKGDGRWLWSDEEILNEVINRLVQNGYFCNSDVITSDLTREKYSYVVYDTNHKTSAKTIRSYAEESGIELLGRFGQFEYWNLDQCFESAAKLAEKLNSNASRMNLE